VRGGRGVGRGGDGHPGGGGPSEERAEGLDGFRAVAGGDLPRPLRKNIGNRDQLRRGGAGIAPCVVLAQMTGSDEGRAHGLRRRMGLLRLPPAARQPVTPRFDSRMNLQRNATSSIPPSSDSISCSPSVRGLLLRNTVM